YMDYCMIVNSAIEEGISIGKEEGIAIGEERAKLEAAKNMINLGVSYDIITQSLGLQLETVQQLAEEIKAETVSG
ncbi:MAG: hypothetical protein MJ159_06805, partial [Treponemataceae bacterium]|nr:hypothetical protein [Treponemataceae bacterium]